MDTETLTQLVVTALEDLKGQDIRVVDVSAKTTITDRLVIVSATSQRHVSSLADSVVTRAKAHQVPPIGVEGERNSEWILVDLGDVVAHVMLPQVRDFYNLEKLWAVGEGEPATGVAG